MRRAPWLPELAGPIAFVALLAATSGLWVSSADQVKFQNALVYVALVAALYVFVGNSGVISFGHMSFVAAGAYLAGLVTLDPETKGFTTPGLFPVLRHAQVGLVPSLAAPPRN